MPHERLPHPETGPSLAAKLRSGRALLWFAGVTLAALAAQVGRADASGPKGTSPAVTTPKGVQKLVNAMRKELDVTHDVTVELVVYNPLKASVEPIKGAQRKRARQGSSRRRTQRSDTRSFRLSIEKAFLEKLTADELRAVIAHELGHVWIYTHHPTCRPSSSRNTIAMRVVARENIVKVYGKVWADAGAAGTLPRFNDEPVAAGLGSPRP